MEASITFSDELQLLEKHRQNFLPHKKFIQIRTCDVSFLVVCRKMEQKRLHQKDPATFSEALEGSIKYFSIRMFRYNGFKNENFKKHPKKFCHGTNPLHKNTKFSFNCLLSKCEHIHIHLQVCSLLLQKSSKGNFIIVKCT